MSMKTAGKTASKAPNVRAGIRPASRPAEIRNVALVGHCGVGKTTLVEYLLAHVGMIGRAGSIAEGTTVCDADPVEVAQQRSVFLAACPIQYGSGETAVRINLLDTPGFADFVGELRAGLRAADAALFVVSAADSLDETTLALWEECAAIGMPRAVVVNRLDAPRADLPATLAACRDAFGELGGNAVLPLYQPGPDGDGLVGLLSSAQDVFAEDRSALIEAVIAESEDETLLDRYLSGASLDPEMLSHDLHTAVGRGHFHPVIPVSATTGLGLSELLELMVSGFPTPLERPAPVCTTPDGQTLPELHCDPDGPLAGEVVRSYLDPYLGRVSLVRLFSGTVRADTALHVSGHGGESRGHPDHDLDERSAALLSCALEPIDAAVAGDLCVIARLATAETGDTISAQSYPMLIQPWVMPDPLLPIALRPATPNDEDPLAKALNRLAASDPGLRIERNAHTGQLVLWCLGEAHSEVVLARLRAGGAALVTEPVRVELLATFADTARGHGRQVKQSGGHGQYAVCDLEISPLPRGSGVTFVDKVVGGAVPNQFIPSVEKGARAQLAHGITSGVPVTDVQVTLFDGKAHSVDSSDAAFQVAAALAVKEAAAAGSVKLLEPIDAVEIIVTDEHIGAVMSDLSARRGRVSGSEPLASNRPGNRSVVRAEVPAVELLRYPITLRSLSAGAGTFRRSYLRHEPAPAAVAAAMLG
ncbi:elongation factor G-like protein EF-G2 [Jatrophihabitans telluris]|uniref:Elongation factor G-like protein EF-G2 n=1 Tax=Jatrophihabitans telluris TaxID=2038343 RepID=A0ABY4QUR6_9ACTN|nr:elongation factor G-like protein EF-G2 [Jatrophihabitans telluris]UQX86817.1 elongation factor G-like protein EF-G2 [Jatrophihabitans telluris]